MAVKVAFSSGSPISVLLTSLPDLLLDDDKFASDAAMEVM